MKHTTRLMIACLFGGLLTIAVAGGLRTSAQEDARLAAPRSPANTGLVNPGFEEATDGLPDGWTEYGAVTFRQVSFPHHEGSHAAVLSNTINYTRWAYQVVQVTGGGPYELSAWAIKNDAHVEGVYVQVRWYASTDGSGAAISTHDSNHLVDDDPGFRHLSTGVVAAPTSARSAQVQLRVDPDRTEGDVTATFDDVSFTAVGSPTLTPTPAPAADVAVAKLGPTLAAPGSRAAYTITLENTGLATATHTLLSDTLPLAAEFITGTTPFSRLGRTLIWKLGDVPAGAARSITLTVRLSATAGAVLVNRVSATTTASETTEDNNTASWPTRIATPPRVLISAVLYDGVLLDDVDEAVQLYNDGTEPVDLSGWELCRGLDSGPGCRDIPPAILSPTARTWLARDAAAFEASFGFAPDQAMSSWLPYGLSNQGGQVILMDEEDSTVDVVVYEEGDTSIHGWDGPAIQPYGSWGQEGQILARIPDEESGAPIGDTDTAADWIQHTGDPIHGRRVLYPGWDLDLLFWPLSVTETSSVTAGISPDTGFEVISRTIARARRFISVETYSLTHPEIIRALVDKAAEGISVTLLLEGSPVAVDRSGAEWQQELWACQQIEAAGGQCWFMAHLPGERVNERYDYVHAKFMVVDGEWLALGSQNLTPRGLPADDKSNGTYGTRGVVLATNAPSVVARAALVFRLDLDPAHHDDLLRWSPWLTGTFGPPLIDYAPRLTTPDHTTTTVRLAEPLAVSGTFAFQLFTAPEAALRESYALLGVVARAGAGDRVRVEQLYEHAHWGDGPNPRLEAYVDAARRGAEVRILLNGGDFGEAIPETENADTIAAINGIARAEGLDLQASLGDPTRCGIHGKTVLVWLHDRGGIVHVGSINGSETSSKVNREMAIQVHSDELYAALKETFDRDWHLSRPAYLPLVQRRHAPPADHLLISEVAYRSWCEWVEVHNPTPLTLDLSGLRVSDAQTVDRYEGTYVFPPREMAPGDVIVVAADATACDRVAADYELFGAHPDVPNLGRDTSRGTGEFGLSNLGDEVLLIAPGGRIVDVVVYGSGGYPGVVPHELVESGYSLERVPAYRDTDDCGSDFVPGWSPGKLRTGE